jgi:hypothetical protein
MAQYGSKQPPLYVRPIQLKEAAIQKRRRSPEQRLSLI